MKKLLLSFSVIVIAAGFAGCKKSSSSSNNATVMFVNGTAGTTSVSVSANNTTVSAAANLGFGKNSGYQNVTAGSGVSIVYSIIGSGLTTPLVSGNEALAANTHYSIFSGGILTIPSIVVTTDDLTAPTGSNAKVRFINLSSDNLNASCYIGNTRLDSNITFDNYTPFIEIANTTDKLTMLDPAAPTNTALIASQYFGPGKIYTVILTGTSAAGTSGSALLGLTVIGNN